MLRELFGMTAAYKTIPLHASVFVLLLSGPAFASGYKIDQQGSKALGMADAFVATADDPSAVYFNPAGLAGLKDPSLYLGASALIPESKYKNASGAEEETNGAVFVPPYFYLAYPSGNIAFGLGVFVPFGLGTKWSDVGLTRYQATESEIDTINVNPAVAVRVQPWLLLGAGANYMRSTANLEKMADQSLVGGTDSTSRLEGDGDGWGYNIGMIFIPDESLRFGLSYRSTIEVEYTGSASLDNIAPALQPVFGGASFSTDASTSIEFPATFTAGAAYMPTEKVTLELDFEKTYWSSYESLDIDLENEVPTAGFVDTKEPKEWRDIWAIRAGFEYRTAERVAVRGGHVFQNNPVPGHTIDPRLPDADQHNLSLGIGYSTAHLTIDAAYMFAYFEDRDVQNNILSGEYQTSGHSAGLSVGYRF